MKEKRNIIEFAGAWSYLSDNEINYLKRNIEKVRRIATQQIIKEQIKINKTKGGKESG